MPKKNNLINKRFGNLVALYQTKSSSHGYYWLCQCDCGRQKEILGNNLISGNTKSCGCQKGKTSLNLFKIKDLSNQTFGYWKVLSRTSKQDKNGNYYWHCQCQCGTQRDVLGSSLTSGKSKSCGCIKSHGEEVISQILKENGIEFQREYSFQDCLTENNYPCRFDFAIFENNNLKFLIEYDGKQHFEDSLYDLTKNQKRDYIKNTYCLNHNIPLYRIPYTDLSVLNNISSILNTKYLLSSKLD